jgi:hypothetical protein
MRTNTWVRSICFSSTIDTFVWCRQIICFYAGDVCLGGATIATPGNSYFEMKKLVPDIVNV